MDELTKTRVENLVSLRHLLTQVLVVLIGGSIGILLTVNTPLKCGLFAAGLAYTIILLRKLNDISNELKSYLYKRRDK